jgi:hypothetical protein
VAVPPARGRTVARSRTGEHAPRLRVDWRGRCCPAGGQNCARAAQAPPITHQAGTSDQRRPTAGPLCRICPESGASSTPVASTGSVRRRCGRICPVGGQGRPSRRTAAPRRRRYTHRVGSSLSREPECSMCVSIRAGPTRRPAVRRSDATDGGPKRRSAPVAAVAGDTSGTIVPRSHYWRRGHGLTAPATLAKHRSTASRCGRRYGEPGWVCSTVGTAATSPSSFGRMVVASRCPPTTSAWSTCPSSVYFAPSSSVLSAYSYSLPAPGGRLDAGTSADDASPNDQNPRRQARVFS